MKAKAEELVFISQINRDGLGVTEIEEDVHFSPNAVFRLLSLSLTEKTFIAHGFNSYVVRIKE